MVKQLLTTAPILGYYDPNVPIVLKVDTRSTELGCVLSIIIDSEGIESPVSFSSFTLSSAEKNFSQIEREVAQ